MQRFIVGIITLVVMLCFFNCGNSMDDFAGTYKVYDTRTSYSLVLNEDGSVNIPEALRPYMGGQSKLEIKR